VVPLARSSSGYWVIHIALVWGNRIARRLLIPDDFLSAKCSVKQWFSTGERFFDKLSTVANALGVSRDCLLVRLQDIVSQDAPYCAFIVGLSKGPITNRGGTKLRIISGLFPSHFFLETSRHYPEVELEKFGEHALNLITKKFRSAKPSSAEIVIFFAVEKQAAIFF
jgi:hypothetical protein